MTATPDYFFFTPPSYFHVLSKEDIFPGRAECPLEIDLGCGEGAFLEEMAAQYPERNFLGVERLQARVERTARRLRQRNLTNAKVLRLDSAYTVGWLLPTAGVSRLHLLCPDPWPKKKHERRRMVSDPEFHASLRRILSQDGEFLLKTDNLPYFEGGLACFGSGASDSGALPGFRRIEWQADAFPYPMTGFEAQWLELGRPIHRARWVRE